LLYFVSMYEGCVVWAAAFFRIQLFFCSIPEMSIKDDAGNLEFLTEFMNSQRNYVILSMSVYNDHFPETGVPEACEYVAEIISQHFFRNHDSTFLSQMMVGMRTIPDGLSYGTSCRLCNLLAKTSIQISIFSVGSR